VLFVGNLARRRNQAAAEWLVWEVWPLLQVLCPQAQLRLVGAEPTSAIEQLGQIPNITVTGWVPDLRAEYAQARVVVAPLHSEAGALNKVLDGLAAARPVVVTSRANAGIEVPEGAIAVVDSAEGFAQAVADLLADEVSWQEIGQRGREFVLSHFDWEAAAERYEAKLRNLLERRND
jgi:glycosyltransferase involved in cell wall biosynthesis